MQRTFVLNLLLLIFINLLIKPLFIFGVDLRVQNEAEPGAYGLYFALLNWTFLFQIVSDFGLQNFNTRHVSRFPHLLEKYYPSFLVIKLLLGALYMVLALLLAWLLGRYEGAALSLLAVLLFNQLLVQLVLFLRSNLAGLGFFRLDSLLSSLDKLLMLLFCGAALVWHQQQGSGYFPVVWFALAQTLALLVTVTLVFGLLQSKTRIAFDPYILKQGRRGWPIVRLLFKKSLPYALVVLLMSAYSRLDSVLLERWLPDGAYHTDVFAGGYRLLDALNMFGYLFATLLLPFFGRLLKEKRPVEPLGSLGFKLIWTGSWAASWAIFAYRHELVALMFPEKSDLWYRADVLGILIWSFLAVCTTYIFSTLLTADERLGTMNRFFIFAILLNLALNSWLIPQYQAYGAAVASVSTQGFIALAMVGLCWKHYDFLPTWKTLLRWVGFSGGLVVLVMLLPYLIGNWQFQLLLFFPAAVLLAFGSRWVEWSELRSLR